jgi:hypothetical protein
MRANTGRFTVERASATLLSSFLQASTSNLGSKLSILEALVTGALLQFP